MRLLRLPTILGYLGVGILVGPHGLGLVREVESVETLAESASSCCSSPSAWSCRCPDLRKVGSRTIAASVLQIGAMMAVGFGMDVFWDGAAAKPSSSASSSP